MPEGTIKRLSLDRGFGLIAAKQQDVFFHRSAVTDVHFDELEEGQTVEYEIATRSSRAHPGNETDRGPQAAFVKPVSTWR